MKTEKKTEENNTYTLAFEREDFENMAMLQRMEYERERLVARLVADVTPLDEDRFWPALDHLNKEITYQLRNKRPLKSGVHEFVRSIRCEGLPGYTFEDIPAFIATYSKLKDELYRPLFAIVKDRGDDAYGDLLDSLPLLGRECIEKLRANPGYFLVYEEELVESHKWIFRGENYIESTLLDKLGYFLPFWMGEISGKRPDFDATPDPEVAGKKAARAVHQYLMAHGWSGYARGLADHYRDPDTGHEVWAPAAYERQRYKDESHGRKT